ncbi:MAG: homoserine dehydrogenase [Candidatus Omnitrophica bacterium]|nr:homoserine dehydrogenase [Candidatus Omnitrophota bacterium]MDD5487450.1 homoserine dehydrogenase [Candidatus Omnitrophota bacterium]
MKTVNIGIIGVGTIGKGVYDAVISNGPLIEKRAGVSLKVKGVCDSAAAALKDISRGKCDIITGSYDDLLNDNDIDVIVELIGGIEPAKSIILGAIRKGKHVVTANKALLSEHWKEIFSAASAKGVSVNFEASVGGAIPVIRTLRDSFVANRIETIYGILNGTTNFILTEMSEKGCSFADALGTAQAKGFAESDPTLDISGADSAHKLAILSVLGFGADVTAKDVYTEGIELVSSQDIRNAARWGYSVKLLAIAKNTADGIELRVHPTLIPVSHLLSGVRGADNAIFIKGDLVGESLLFGKGAGSRPTASSVMGDIIEIARNMNSSGSPDQPACDPVFAPGGRIKKMEDIKISYYLRFSVIDKPGVLAGISSVLAKNNISIASVSQDERNEGGPVPVIILTHKALEGDMRKAIMEADKLEHVSDSTVAIRMEQ